MTALESGVVAHALRALADHIEQRHLPAPVSIGMLPRELNVRIPGDRAEEWAASLVAGDGIRCLATQTVHHTRLSNFETCGLLPDTGVRLRLQWSTWTLSSVEASA